MKTHCDICGAGVDFCRCYRRTLSLLLAALACYALAGGLLWLFWWQP